MERRIAKGTAGSLRGGTEDLRRSGTNLLEREREIDEIELLLDDALEGDGRAILLRADPGIGKTTLLKAARDAGAEKGFKTLTVRADALEGELSFGVCGQLFAGIDDDALFDGAAGRARPILGGAAEIPAAIGEDRILSLIHGLYWLTANLADAEPLLICVDDAHWADIPSLRYMNYLTRRLDGLRAALVVASRPVDRGTDRYDLLAALAADPGCVTLTPGGLSAEAVSRLVEGELGDAAEDLVAACHRLSGGNPLYLEELLRSAAQSGVDPTDGSLGDLRPEGVADSVLARLAGLGDGARRVAEMTAVGGGRLQLRDAAELTGIEMEDARKAADALVRAAILDAGEPLRFAHPLVQSAVYASVPDAERRGAHLAVAHRLHEGGAPHKAVSVQLLSAELGGGDWVIDELEAAAGEEIVQGSPASAARFLQRAVDEGPPADRLGRLLTTLGLAETEAGDEKGAERLMAAVDHLPQAEERAGVLLALGTTLAMQARMPEASAALERGLNQLEGAGGGIGRELEYMFAIGLDHDAKLRAAALPRLEELIRTPGIDDSATGRALLGHAASERAYQGGSLSELRELAGRATASGLNEEDPMAFWAWFFTAYAYNDSDDFKGAERASAKALELARARGSSVQAAAALHPRSFLNLRAGNIEAAVADAQTTVEGAAAGWHAGHASGLSVLGEAYLERGELDKAAEACKLPGGDEFWKRHISYAWMLDTRGRVELAQGDAEKALVTLLECGECCERSMITNPSVLAWRSGAAMAAARLGDTRQALELAETELDWAMDFGTPRAIGVARRTIGLVTGGDDGIDHIREALTVFASSPAKLEHARTLVDLGSALRRAGRRREARDPLREGLDMAHRLGAVAVAQRGQDELAATGARPRRVELTGVESLTPSERRICAMAAEGSSNPQIAQDLFLTRRTVEMHLTNAYRKLDIGSRKDLSAALETEGAG